MTKHTISTLIILLLCGVVWNLLPINRSNYTANADSHNVVSAKEYVRNTANSTLTNQQARRQSQDSSMTPTMTSTISPTAMPSRVLLPRMMGANGAMTAAQLDATATPTSYSSVANDGRRFSTSTSEPLGTDTPWPTSTASITPTFSKTPTRTRTFTPPPLTLAVRNPSFESGTQSWRESSVNRSRIIQRIPAMARTGSWLAVLGDNPREVMEVSQLIFVPKSKPTLTFYYKITSTEACGRFYDTVRVFVHTKEMWKLDACRYQVSSRWLLATINLRAYAGKYVSLRFHMRTDGLNHSAWFIDDIGWR